MAHPAKSMHAKGTTPTEPRQRVQHLSRQDRRGCPILSRSVRKGGSRHHHTGIGIASDPTPAGISVRGTHPCKKRKSGAPGGCGHTDQSPNLIYVEFQASTSAHKGEPLPHKDKSSNPLPVAGFAASLAPT